MEVNNLVDYARSRIIGFAVEIQPIVCPYQATEPYRDCVYGSVSLSQRAAEGHVSLADPHVAATCSRPDRQAVHLNPAITKYLLYIRQPRLYSVAR